VLTKLIASTILSLRCHDGEERLFGTLRTGAKQRIEKKDLGPTPPKLAMPVAL
jgi:hypothetical protein